MKEREPLEYLGSGIYVALVLLGLICLPSYFEKHYKKREH